VKHRVKYRCRGKRNAKLTSKEKRRDISWDYFTEKKYCFWWSMCTMSRSQWPRGLRHKMSSPAWTLGSWVRIPLEAWMFVCVYSVLSCVSSGLATSWSLVQGVLPIVCKRKITEPHKEDAKARYGLERLIRRRRRVLWFLKIEVRWVIISEPML
jgi:hypothetical protein